MYGPDGPFIVGDSACIVRRDGRAWSYPYTLAPDGLSVELGQPTEVHLSWQERPVRATEPRDDRLAFVTDLRGLRFDDTDTVEIEVCRDGSPFRLVGHG